MADAWQVTTYYGQKIFLETKQKAGTIFIKIHYKDTHGTVFPPKLTFFQVELICRNLCINYILYNFSIMWIIITQTIGK